MKRMICSNGPSVLSMTIILSLPGLCEPREGLGESGWLGYVAASIALATVVGMLVVLEKEGLGPLAAWNRRKGQATEQKHP